MKIMMAVLCLVGLTACGPDLAWDGDPTKCSFVESGTCYQVDTIQPTAKPTWVAYTREQAEEALQHPGVLNGYLVILTDTAGDSECPVACNWVEEKKIRIWMTEPASLRFLVHEAGHEDLDNHHDPAWELVRAKMYALGEYIRVVFAGRLRGP